MSALEQATRVRDWRRAAHASVCDVLAPWEHGTVLRATRYPTYYEYNLVRVEEDPEVDARGLEALADRALAGLQHRRIDFEVVEAADALRPALTAAGWKSTRLLWMRHEQPPPPGSELEAEEVSYEDVEELRLSWHLEDFDDHEYEEYRRAAREVAMSRAVTVLAVREKGHPIAFAQLERLDGMTEISSVYVHPDRRGAGRGTALTRAAILAAGCEGELWICADDEDRPKDLYSRLGFNGVWRTMEFLKLP